MTVDATGVGEPAGSRCNGRLVGRDRERAEISRLLEDARRQSSGSLVLSGEPGIGKSALCAWAAGTAADMRVLTVRGVESEIHLPFAGLAELCAGELHLLEQLPAPQAQALAAGLARRDAPVPDRLAVGAAVVSLLGVMSDRESVLVVVDDAQWLDQASARALLFAARRLRGERVALLVGTRPGGAFDDDRTGLRSVALEGLDADAARALLGDGVCDAVLERLIVETAGNPLALLEVSRAMTAAQRAGVEPMVEPLPLGPKLSQALLERVMPLEPAARFALVIAAANPAERVQPVMDALHAEGVEPSALEPAERLGAIRMAGERFEFRHPLLRSAVYHAASGPTRRAAHAALARVSGGAEGAWHLAQATLGEDEQVAAAMEHVGMEARRRTAPAAAARALEHAARLSRPGPARVRRLTEAARDSHVAGRPATALRLLDDALTGSGDARQRADIQHIRGRVLMHQGRSEAGHHVLVREAALIRDADPERAATMLADACINRCLAADVEQALQVARHACDVAAAASAGVRAFADVMLASTLVLGGERAEATVVLDRLLPVLRRADPLAEAGELVGCAAQAFFWLDRHDIAAELLDRLTTAARKASAPAALVLPLCCRAELDLRVGDWTRAAAQFEEAGHLGEELSRSVFAAYASECLARLAAVTGDEEGCRDHAARALTLIDAHCNELGRIYVQGALGLLDLSQGRIDSAISELEAARDVAVRGGIAEPNVGHWRADLVEAYVRAGRPASALDALAELEDEAERTGGLWALGVSARCRALVAGDVEYDSLFALAVTRLEAARAPFEVARTHLSHGERLRRAGRRTDARCSLRTALDAFDRLGAEPWIRRARSELRATGATPRRRRDGSHGDQLTAHELQIATIVAGGASNKDAAAALFLSAKTIEFHLASIYRKLGVRGRTELAGVAARRGWLDRSD